VAVLWPAGAQREGSLEHVFCVVLGERSRAPIAAFLREHADPSLEVSVIGLPAMPAAERAATLEVLGIHARVKLIPSALVSLRAAIDAEARAGPIDLVVVARVPTLLLLGYQWPAPVLLVPGAARPAARGHAFDLTDVAEVHGTVQARVDDVTAVGTLAAAADVALAFVGGGRLLATGVTSPSGEIDIPADLAMSSLGAVRVVDDAPPDAVAAVEQRFAVLRPTEDPLLVFDAELSEERLRVVRDGARVSGVEPLAVRLRPTARAAVLRERLRTAGVACHIVDARAILDEGEALDVAEANDPVRLRRVAARLLSTGFRIASVLDAQLDRPEPLVDTPALWSDGNHVEVELDNARARRWLLDAIAQSSRSVSVQVYMVVDDDVGRAIEAALAAAASRGVTVRVLVDSLHGMHGSFGTENPLLSRLAAHSGIEVRVSHPLTSVPSLTDLKQRDHRKIVVIDDRIALVGGRNFSHEYYTGFDEARLDAAATWRMVPWLDAGARIEGPAVTAIAACFIEAWVEAGGAPFSVDQCPPVGSTRARVVAHRGLRDAYTLEAYLDLIERAESHIYAVNGFPYVLELQHAFVRALRRGVHVRALSGHLTPMHDETQFAGAWSSARGTATEFVHSRLDPIVDAGGEVYFFAQRGGRGWQPDLGVVHPHVHAKLMSVDGERCAVGSANFDVTSSYWESELMLVVEDGDVTRALEARLDALIAGSTRVNRDDAAWRERARRRSWMRRWPGVLAL
jgi:phosphatidylserine/phosphatidylglycerophosphate/cardiolipin synthase-like enzyme